MPDGNWMVGYGHVRLDRAGQAVSEGEAAHLLALDLAPVERLVNDTVTTTITQSQFDALVSFALSVGAEAFQTSQVLRRINKGDYLSAAYAMDAWRKAEVAGELCVVGALVRRRADEKAMLLRDMPLEPSPSAFLRAKLDHAASVLAAPVCYAPAPETGPVAAGASSPFNSSSRLAEILRSEPTTEALLLTHVVVDEDDVGEITSAHAKPVARPLDSAREAVRQAQAEQAARRKGLELPRLRHSALLFLKSNGVEKFGPIALLGLGLALMLVGGSMFMADSADAAGLLGASAVAVLGLAASLIAGLARLDRRKASAAKA
jgi:GH24 family phage-related lysozyme (muramidase)